MARADEVAGHQVGRELNAVELQVQHVGERLNDLRLPQPRNAFEKDVPAGEQARQDAPDDLLIADDDAAHLLLDGIVLFVEVADFFLDRDHGSEVDSDGWVRMDRK